MNRDEIEKIALDNGFKLKQQPDGSMALNPYVFEFAKSLLSYAENESRKSAARYHWLRENLNRLQSMRPYHAPKPEELDAAIDAALNRL